MNAIFSRGLGEAVNVSRRRCMVDSGHARLSVARQCILLKTARSDLYYKCTGESVINLALMQKMDQAFTEWPFPGVRQMCRYLVSLGCSAGKKRIRLLVRLMGRMAVCQEPKISISNTKHKHYLYLLRNIAINKSNQAWCADITDTPMHKDFLHLVAIMDWHNRKVLSWRLSDTIDADFCVSALEETLEKYGSPGSFNTD